MFSTRYDETENIWYGPDIAPLYNPNINLAHALLHSMSMFGSKVAQISDDSGIRMTFDEIRIKTIRAAQNFQTLGYQPKQVVGFMVKNSDFVAPIFFASIGIGCPISPLDASFKKPELIHLLNITKPVLFFCDITSYDLLSECLTELGNAAKIFTFGGQKGQSEPIENLFKETHNEHNFIPAKVDGRNDPVLIVCSSGTTGLPKGVCLAHASLLDELVQFCWTNSHDVMLCFSSLYWLTGCLTLLRCTLFGTIRLITTEPFTPELQLRLIERYRVTFTFNATHHIILMTKSDQFHKTDLSSIKAILVGGTKVPFHIKTEFKNRIPNGNIIIGYGLSENSGPFSIDYPVTYGKDTVGRLFGGSAAKIVNENGERCGVNVDGEICIKGNYKFIGYYNNKQATDDVIDAEGFLKTGDIGHFDADGNLYFVDRKKELLKYCNAQVSPSEIDAFLTETPDIKSACVVGIPDAVANDLPAAVIVRAEGSKMTEKDVYDLVADRFSDHYKLRGGVYFVDSLPITPSGKVLRRQVQEIASKLFISRND